MEVYIEYVMLDNLVINWLIMVSTLLLMKKKPIKKRLLLADLVATCTSIIMPWITLQTWAMFGYKMVIGAVLVSIFSTYRTPKEYCMTFFMFFTMTFVFGGLCYGIIAMLQLDTSMSGILVWGFELPMSIFFIAVVLYGWLTIKIIKYCKKREPIDKMYYDLILYQNGKKVSCKGFLDTGNKLKSKNNSGLLIIGLATFCKLYDHINYMDLCQGQTPIQDSYYIDVKAVGNSSKMLVTTIDKVEIFSASQVTTITHKDIGIAMTNFKEFDCILGSMDVLGLEGNCIC